MANFVIALIGAAGFFFLLDALVSLIPRRPPRLDGLQGAVAARAGEDHEPFTVTRGMPFLDRAIRGLVGDLERGDRKREEILSLLRRSGWKYRSVGDLYAARVVFAALFFLGGAIAIVILGMPWMFPVPFLMGVVGYQVPLQEVRSEIKKRRQAIRTEMPFLLERLGYMVRGGLAILDATLRVTEIPSGLFSHALRRLAIGLATGIQDADRYIQDFLDDLPEDHELTGLADRIRMALSGARVSEALLVMADRVRSRLAAETLARGMRATIYVTVVGGGLMLPALALLMAGPPLVMALKIL